MNKGGRRQRRYEIFDRERLARGVKRVLDEVYEGSQSHAARALRIPQTQLSRLIRKERPTIEPKNYERLKRLFSQLPGMERELQQALVSPNEQNFLSAYGRWLQEWNLILSRGALWARWEGRGIPSRPLEHEQLLKKLSKGWKLILSHARWEERAIPLRLSERERLLKRLSQFPKLWDSFRTFLSKRGHSGARADMAFDRIVDPLLDNKDSAFIERSWQELSDDELRKFVRAGIVREQVLLDRSPDAMRAQQVARVVQKTPSPNT